MAALEISPFHARFSFEGEEFERSLDAHAEKTRYGTEKADGMCGLPTCGVFGIRDISKLSVR